MKPRCCCCRPNDGVFGGQRTSSPNCFRITEIIISAGAYNAAAVMVTRKQTTQWITDCFALVNTNALSQDYTRARFSMNRTTATRMCNLLGVVDLCVDMVSSCQSKNFVPWAGVNHTRLISSSEALLALTCFSSRIFKNFFKFTEFMHQSHSNERGAVRRLTYRRRDHLISRESSECCWIIKSIMLQHSLHTGCSAIESSACL